jgi:hypothetical protein
MMAAMFSSFHSSLSSPSSAANAVDPRKNRRLMPMATSRYAAIVSSCLSPIRLSRFNVSRTRSEVHLRPFGSAGHKWDEIASFSHTIASSRCWNGSTSHKYHTSSSPTSRGKYR